MLDSAGNSDVRVCPLERRIHSAFRTSALNFVMLALIVFHGAVFGSNIMDPSSSFNPIDNTTRDKTVLSLFKKNRSDAEIEGRLSALSRSHRRLMLAAYMTALFN